MKSPEARYKPTDAEEKAIKEVENAISEAKRWHTQFARKVERRYDAWRGMRADAEENGWRSNITQPLLINIVEGMLATMEEAKPVWSVTPMAIPGMTVDEAMDAGRNADIVSHLLNFQFRIDDFGAKQSPFMLQDLVAGYTVGKVRWLKEERVLRYLDERAEMIYDDADGSPLDLAMVLEEREDAEPTVLRDDPTFEPRDVRDFLYPESATSVETAPWVIDRTFIHYKTLERMEELGVYKNVKFVKETRHNEDTTSRQGPDTVQERERRLRSVDRTRGLVEVVEYWTDERVVTVANRTVLLRDTPNPFSHGKKPFVVVSAIPDMFQLPGISVIEGLAQMQEMVWTLQNLRLDTTRMAANLITLIRGDAENPDDFEWAPNAQWFVTDPNQVKTLEINPAVATTTLQAEALLKGDIQNVMGGLPYTGGAQSQTIDQTTATGISIVTNIAQAILQRRRQQYLRSFAKIGQHFVALDQQFLRESRLIEISGEAGARAYAEVDWDNVRGIFDIDVEMVGDSLMRQERRAESGQLLTQAVQFAGPSAQMGVKLNIRKFWEKHLEAYDISDKEAYFMEQPQPAQGQGALPPSEGAGTRPDMETMLAQLQGGIPQGGATNEALAAGPTSPSSDMSMSPAAASSRALAMNGAGRSV